MKTSKAVARRLTSGMIWSPSFCGDREDLETLAVVTLEQLRHEKGGSLLAEFARHVGKANAGVVVGSA